MEIYLEEGREKEIQKAIDECSRVGGGRVVLREGTYISGTLCLKEGVILYLEKGALLLGSRQIGDYPDNESCFVDAVGHKRGKAFIYAFRTANIGIEGDGVIDGRGGEFPPEHKDHLERPFLARFVECRGVTIRGMTLRQSAAWCLHIQDSEQVKVEGVSISNRCNGNNDGIDIDGCTDVVIQNCLVDSGDDALCLKSTSMHPCRRIMIRNCRVTSNWAAFKIGTESVGDFEDIEVADCVFYDVLGCGIKIVPVDGGNVRKLWIHDIRMYNCTGPIFVSTGERLRKYFQAGRDFPGSIEEIRLERITAEAVSAIGGIYEGKPWGNAEGCVVLSGLKEYPLRNITLKDCYFSMPGGTNGESREKTAENVCPVPEMETQYPEFHLFDPLPSWGIYLRHGADCIFDNVQLDKRKADSRPMMIKEDTVNVSER